MTGFEVVLGIDPEGQEGSHREGMVPEETRLEVQDTSQGVHRRALEETHQGLELHHDPSQQAEEDRKAGIEDAERREEHLEVAVLAGALVADRADFGVAVGEELELEEVGDLSIENESVICRLLFPRNRTVDSL
jgi:hypothetical protein